MKNIAKKTIHKTLDAIFPPVCLSCNKYLKTNQEEKEMICSKCIKTININKNTNCTICGARVPQDKIRPSCHSKNGIIVAVCAQYENRPVRELIRSLKYKNISSTIIPIKKYIIEPYIKHIKGVWREDKKYIITPIPLRKRKERARGFNQSMLIANALAECIRKTIKKEDSIVIYQSIVKTKTTEPHATIPSYEERKENIKNSFKFDEERVISISKNTITILVDDVTTSGATINEGVRALKKAGINKIMALTLAKA